MALVRNIVTAVAALALAVLFVAAGLAVCLAPPATHGLSSVYARDDLSPFDRNELVKVADATREYSFGAHDKLALYQVIYDIDVEYRDKVGFAGANSITNGFPRVDLVTDRSNLAQMESAFNGASELFCYSPETVSHLDDCYRIMQSGLSSILAIAIAAIAALAFTGVTGGKRRIGAALMTAGAVVLIALIGLGAWALVDFRGFFAAFHSIFFAQGSWTFPYDSLLICSLPTEFWMGMGAICLAVSVALSILSFITGFRLKKR